jgi:phosphoglycerate kinase
VIADKIGADAEYEVAEYNNLPANKMTVDIWPRTRKKYEKILRNAWFILWIGPMGVYEIPACKGGNDAIMDAVAHSGANSFLWWGDTIASVANHPLKHAVAHFSTWWWATLRYLEHGTLPGIDALDDYAL